MVACRAISNSAALLTQTIGNLNALTVFIAKAAMQNDFKSFSTQKIREKRHSGDHFDWEL